MSGIDVYRFQVFVSIGSTWTPVWRWTTVTIGTRAECDAERAAWRDDGRLGTTRNRIARQADLPEMEW